jgi:hypothetical protein
MTFLCERRHVDGFIWQLGSSRARNHRLVQRRPSSSGTVEPGLWIADVHPMADLSDPRIQEGELSTHRLVGSAD